MDISSLNDDNLKSMASYLLNCLENTKYECSCFLIKDAKAIITPSYIGNMFAGDYEEELPKHLLSDSNYVIAISEPDDYRTSIFGFKIGKKKHDRKIIMFLYYSNKGGNYKIAFAVNVFVIDIITLLYVISKKFQHIEIADLFLSQWDRRFNDHVFTFGSAEINFSTASIRSKFDSLAYGFDVEKGNIENIALYALKNTIGKIWKISEECIGEEESLFSLKSNNIQVLWDDDDEY